MKGSIFPGEKWCFFMCVIGPEKLLPTYLFGFLSVLGLGFIVAPIPLKPVFNAWQQFAHLISKVITNLILILIYYIVRIRKRYWLLPIEIVMLLFSALIVFAESSSIVPFIYALF